MTRAKSGRFLKGHSGNPGGRPAIPREIRIAARSNTLDAMMVLSEVMRSPRAPAAARVQAAAVWLRFAYGSAALDADDAEDASEVEAAGGDAQGAGSAVLSLAEGAMVRILAVVDELVPHTAMKLFDRGAQSDSR